VRGCRRKVSVRAIERSRAVLERTAESHRGWSEPDCFTELSDTQSSAETDILTHRASRDAGSEREGSANANGAVQVMRRELAQPSQLRAASPSWIATSCGVVGRDGALARLCRFSLSLSIQRVRTRGRRTIARRSLRACVVARQYAHLAVLTWNVPASAQHRRATGETHIDRRRRAQAGRSRAGRDTPRRRERSRTACTAARTVSRRHQSSDALSAPGDVPLGRRRCRSVGSKVDAGRPAAPRSRGDSCAGCRCVVNLANASSSAHLLAVQRRPDDLADELDHLDGLGRRCGRRR